jgi:ornithine carbamoyltransferase
MQQRTELLKAGNKKGLGDLEQTCLAENAKFKDWEYNDAMKKLTKSKDALYMHCLPADISGISCKEGEVNADVFEEYRIKTYHEAGFKPYIIAAMMFTNKFEHPVQALKEILERGRKRFGV